MDETAVKQDHSRWTDEQWQAISARNQNILVSAAAGSGKTAVLVERIIRRLTDKENPVDVDRLLVVTFTNAAAAEMRQRIGEALEEALATDPANLHLRRQLSLLNKASISTLHAFCIDVLRMYYHHVSIDPGFRILDETEAVLLREEVLENLFESYYGMEEADRFYELVDTYSSDRSDARLQKLVLKLYDFSRSHPAPRQWLEKLVDKYRVDSVQKMEEIPWAASLLDELRSELRDARSLLEEGYALTQVPGGPYPYAETLTNDLAELNRLIEADATWLSLYNAFQSYRVSRLKPCKGDDIDACLKDEVKSFRERAIKRINKVRDDFFSREPADFVQDLVEFAPIIETLVEIVGEFSDRFDRAKFEKGVLEFSDLEHLCLQVLTEPSSAETRIPSEAAKDFQHQFVEVLVDEYQDINFVQEAIIQLITRGNNTFMVGDVKQSIYRFRLAEPTLFLQKYKQFSKDGNDYGLRIDLASNFRSRQQVIAGTNYIFKQIMNEQLGELEYDEDAELKHAFPYPQADQMEAELLLIDRSASEQTADDVSEEVEELEREQLEARLIAKQIKALIGKDGNGRARVYDKDRKCMRPVTYRDIVILMRSLSSSAQTILDELKAEGIPAYAEMSSGYFDATEVAVMMALLRVIDNPDQDIPLASVLRSPIVALTEEELARIRIADQKASYFQAMKTYMRQEKRDALYEKVSGFYDSLTRWRTRARQGALSDLIWQLYRETNYYDFVAGMPGGQQRQANLRALYDRARQYEQTSLRGLFRFLRFIERMQDLGRDLGTARALGEQEDVVRLMTIHKSKGLEFPVVFVAGLSKPFNMQDLNANVLLHKSLGLGTKFIDTKRRVSYPTLLHHAVKRKLRAEMLAEEMRVLYVALTRAREKLFLVATLKDAGKQIQKWQTHLQNDDWVLATDDRRKSKCYLDWIGPALIRHRDAHPLRERLQVEGVQAGDVYEHESTWRVSFISAGELDQKEDLGTTADEEKLLRLKKGQPINEESGKQAQVDAQLNWTYPYERSTAVKSKQTVTELKRQREVFIAGEPLPALSSGSFMQDRPKFMQKQQLTATERGTAMHTVMQHVPMTNELTLASLRELLDEMVTKEILTREQRDVIPPQWIVDFFASPLFEKVKTAVNMYREIPFSYSLPFHEVQPRNGEETDDQVVIQGVIDLIVEEDDGLTIIDYKTDAITDRFQGGFDEAKPLLLDRYRVQLELYEKAISDIWKKPVKAKYLYFFDGSHVLTV